MVSGNEHHIGVGQCGKQVIDFFQLSDSRDLVKQVAGDQKQVNLILIAYIQNRSKRSHAILCPLAAPGAARIRHQSQMNVGDMDKFHGNPHSWYVSSRRA